MPNYSLLPEHMRKSFRDYVEDGRPPGKASFMMAVLRNQLVQSVVRADAENYNRIQDYANWLYNEAPEGSWGSEEIAAAWVLKSEERREGGGA